MRYFIWKAEPPLRRSDILVQVRDDGAIAGIPMVESCPEYVAYQTWLSQGNEPDDWKPWESVTTDGE